MGFWSEVKNRIGIGERKAYLLSDPAVSEIFGVRTTTSGVSVGGLSALNTPAVLQAVRLISESIGSLPVKLYREQAEAKEIVSKHTAHKIVHTRANEWTGAGAIRTQLTSDALIYGNGFARVVRYPDGRPFELIRLLPGTVSVMEDSLGAAPPFYRVSENGGSRDYSHTEILHIPSFLNRSPISFGREAIGLASVLEKHGATFFTSGARPNAIISNEKAQGGEAGATIISNMRKSFREWMRGASADPLILDGGWKYEAPALTSTDSQYVENRLEQINEISRVFGVPPHLLFQLERATWSNAEQMGASFLQLCLRPWLDKWQEALATVLLTEIEQNDHWFEFVVDDLMRADMASRTANITALVTNRVMSPNEARAILNMPPLPGGDELIIGFREAANIVRMDRRLVAATKINDAFNSAKRILNRQNGATLKAISSDGKAQHGTTPNFILIDEIHQWKGRDLWEALDSGTTKVADPLTIICTTAGRGQDNLGFEQYDYAYKVATGEIDDPTVLPILFQLEPGDDWRDEATWLKANPGLPYGFPNIVGLRNKLKEAENSPPARYQFQQLNLNVWQAASRDPLFDMAVYDAGRDPNFDLADLEGLPCWLGVDLSRSGDLTAIVGAWRHNDGRITVHPWFFLPSEGLEDKAKVEQVPYSRWRDDGLLNVINGPVIEPDVIADKIIDLCGTFAVREVIFDPSLAGPLMGKLIDHGITVLQLPQTAKHMHGPICDLERIVNGRRIRHGAHPILRNHFESVVVKRATNAGELTTMHKGTRHSNHIDGAIASALSVFRAAANDSQRSIYDLPEDEFAALMAEAG